MRVVRLLGILLFAASAFAADDLASHSVGGFGVSFSDRDPAVRPGDDFYMWQNGGWFARTEIPADKFAASYWLDLKSLAPARLHAILEQVAANKNASPDSPEGKAGAFFRAYMDETRVELLGTKPLKPELDAIRAANTKLRMAELMGAAAGPKTQRSQNANVPPQGRSVFALTIAQDQRNPGRYALYIGQGGLMLPAPDYYTNPKFAEVKKAYEQYIAKILTTLEWPEPEKRAQEVVAFETRIAEGSWSLEQMQDPTATYNPTTLPELYRLAPGFDWRAFLKGAEINKTDHIVIDARSTFPKIAAIFEDAPIEVLQARMAFDSADDRAVVLNHAIESANFEFRSAVLNGGAVKHPPRWRRGVVTVMEISIGEILGKLYVDHYFSPESKAKGLEMVANLRKALDARLQNLAWMNRATTEQARQKLAKMQIKLGYPDKFRDYQGLKITDDDLYGDFDRGIAYDWRRQVVRLNTPFNRSEWLFTPQQANYNYLPTPNAVESPAATMEAPFFDIKADDAVNYGAMGTLLGLSIMQGFSDAGHHYDGDGHLRDWWTEADEAKFHEMTQRLAAQYSAVEPLPGIHVNGKLVLNESLSDLGGLSIALDAYHLSLNGKPAPVIHGYTGDQRFFLGWAQMWRAKFRPNFIRNQQVTGQNAPPFLRVNGPLHNLDAWYAAFDVKPGDKMYLPPEERVRIW